MVTQLDLQKISGKRSRSKNRTLFLKTFNREAARYGVTSQEDIAKFLANVCVETGGFTRFRESLNYSVDGLMQTFSRRRISAADCRKYGRTKNRRANQRAIANIVYGGAWGKKHLGNTQPGDGWKYRGAGPGQVTGRGHFTRVSKITGIDFVNNPEWMADPVKGTIAMLEVWQYMGMNNLEPVAGRRKWNGGTHGLPDFKRYFARADKLDLSLPGAVVETAAPEPADDPFVEEAAFADAFDKALADEQARVTVAHVEGPEGGQIDAVAIESAPRRRPAVTELVEDVAAHDRVSTELPAAGLTGVAATTGLVASIAEDAKGSLSVVAAFVPDWFIPVALATGAGGAAYWYWRRWQRQQRARKALEG